MNRNKTSGARFIWFLLLFCLVLLSRDVAAQTQEALIAPTATSKILLFEQSGSVTVIQEASFTYRFSRKLYYVPQALWQTNLDDHTIRSAVKGQQASVAFDLQADPVVIIDALGTFVCELKIFYTENSSPFDRVESSLSTLASGSFYAPTGRMLPAEEDEEPKPEFAYNNVHGDAVLVKTRMASNNSQGKALIIFDDLLNDIQGERTYQELLSDVSASAMSPSYARILYGWWPTTPHELRYNVFAAGTMPKNAIKHLNLDASQSSGKTFKGFSLEEDGSVLLIGSAYNLQLRPPN